MEYLYIFGKSSALAFAQSPKPTQNTDPAQGTAIRVNVDLVQVGAVVTDSEDRPVTDLKIEEFVILQDGIPQEITNLPYIRTKDEATIAEMTSGRPKYHERIGRIGCLNSSRSSPCDICLPFHRLPTRCAT